MTNALPIERLAKLKAVTTIVVHDNCADGTGSALLLKSALPDAEVVFVQHGTDAYKNLPAQPGMLFCDISPPAERLQEFVRAGAVVLDHHKTARATVAAFGPDGIFADEGEEPGVSGTVLAYRHVWQPLMGKASPAEVSTWVENFATLTGIRDTWQNKHPRWIEACQQAHLMHFMPNTEWLKYPLSHLVSIWETRFAWVAPILDHKHARSVQKSVKRAGRYKTKKGTHLLVMASTSHTSDAAELLGSEVDVIVGFGFDVEDGVEKLILSTRSHTSFNCSDFAKMFGGGGHTKAAGVSVPVYPDESPYRTILRMIDAYEAGERP